MSHTPCSIFMSYLLFSISTIFLALYGRETTLYLIFMSDRTGREEGGRGFSMASLHWAWKRFLFCFCSYKTHPCSLRLPLLGQTWNITWSASFWVHECVCSPWFIVLLQLNPFLQPVYHLPLSLSPLYIHNIHQCINIYLAIYHPIYITINLSIYLSMRSLSSSLSFFLF